MSKILPIIFFVSFFLITVVGCGKQKGATIEGNLAVSSSNSGAYVLLCKVSDSSDPQTVCMLDPKLATTTNGAGSFTFEDVPSGTYVVVYALPQEAKGNPQEWGKMEVHYHWPLFGVPADEVKTTAISSMNKYRKQNHLFTIDQAVDPFGGTEGILTSKIPFGFPLDKDMLREGVYKSQKAVYAYPYSSVVISKQYGLSIYYEKEEPQIILVKPKQKVDLTIQ